jgi:hypothetical protein
MAKRIRLFGPVAISTTATTVYTNVTGKSARLESFIVAQPAAGLAKTVRVSVGTDAAGTRSIEYPIAAGAGTTVLYPNIVLTGTEVLQLSTTADTGVAIGTGNGSEDAV